MPQLEIGWHRRVGPMRVALFDVAPPGREYPPGGDPAVSSRMLSLDEYLATARRLIGAYATPSLRGMLLNSDDAVAHVAHGLMVADWGYEPGRGTSPSTWRVSKGLWALGDYAGKLAGVDSGPPVYDADGALPDRRPADPVRRLCVDEEREERLALVSTMSSALTPTQRECLRMHYAEGLGKTAISEALGVRRQTVGQSIKSGLRRLRRTAEAPPCSRSK